MAQFFKRKKKNLITKFDHIQNSRPDVFQRICFFDNRGKKLLGSKFLIFRAKLRKLNATALVVGALFRRVIVFDIGFFFFLHKYLLLLLLLLYKMFIIIVVYHLFYFRTILEV